MNPDELSTLIGGGESLAVEFKSEGRAPLNDRDLVVQYVKKHGRITWGDVAELWRLSIARPSLPAAAALMQCRKPGVAGRQAGSLVCAPRIR
ncbi:MAG TPA: hypothetical protein DCL15_03205 [Chloroflexi bacterium]|nr:hypothetical protein [Chloroflexota bacterium]